MALFKRGTIDENQNIETIIGPSVKVEGDFESHGDVTIEGNLTGSLKTKGVLVVGESAVIQANIEAQSVNVAGTVKGNIRAKDKVVLEKTARLEGDISASSVALEEGCYFIGNCTMAKQEAPFKEREAQSATHEIRVKAQS